MLVGVTVKHRVSGRGWVLILTLFFRRYEMRWPVVNNPDRRDTTDGATHPVGVVRKLSVVGRFFG